MFDDKWICPRCHKPVHKNRSHIKSHHDRYHVRCMNEIEKEQKQRDKKLKDQLK